VIASVQEVRVKGDAGAIGTLGGAAAGGVAGAQFGKKSGKILATIGGAILGGFAGREVEKQVRASNEYDVVVNMEEGGSRTLRIAALNGLGIGSRVRVSGNTLVPN
jgi:outer membrane lipoprotein SlyB